MSEQSQADQRDGVRQVLMHEALVPAFDAWLASRGLECRCIGKFSEEDLPSWVVSPTDETLRRAASGRAGESAVPSVGDRVRITSGDYVGRCGTYEGQEEDAYRVHLDDDSVRDPAVRVDSVALDESRLRSGGDDG